MNPLKQFYDNQPLKEAWAQFIIETLNDEALRRVYAGRDTSALKEASDIITKSFAQLNEQFAPKKKRTPKTRAV